MPHPNDWSPLGPTQPPYYGGQASGDVVIRRIGSATALDRGVFLERDTFTVSIRSERTGQRAVYPMLSVRVEPVAR